MDSADLLRPDAIEQLEIRRFEAGRFSHRSEPVVRESRISVFVDGREMVRLLALPIHIEELVTGFLLNECMIHEREEILDISFNPRSMSAEVRLAKKRELPPIDPVRSITSGCGKGVTFVSPLGSPFFPPIPESKPVHPRAIVDIMRKVQKSSALFRETGGVHSASVWEMGEALFSADDIGRHNAVDKVLGWLLQSGKITSESDRENSRILTTTGRLSSEIISKAVRGRIPILVSPSAPTSAAVQLGGALGVTIIGFARGERFNVYTHPERILES